MNYDVNYVAEWRKKAITNLADFKVGETYYSTIYGKIKVKRILTHGQHYSELGIKASMTSREANSLSWFEFDCIGINKVGSLDDNNISASYNPWLIFKDKDTMVEYRKGLVVTYERELWEDMDPQD